MTAAFPPLYMWAGGKGRLLKHYERFWPDDSDLHYVEPFFGGGAVFGWRSRVRGQLSASLGDVNVELVGLLEQVKVAPLQLISDVEQLARELLSIETKPARKDWYYRQRARYWSCPTPARLYVLMRTGFNGIWQTCAASNGLFGTPAGLLNQTRISQLVDTENMLRWSTALQGAQLHAGSYRDLPRPGTPSLFFLDPPYRDSFTTYGTGFSDVDQRQLASWYRDRVAEGHTVILANRCVEGELFFEELIGDIATFHYFDVTYTAGRRKRIDDTFEAKAAREFIAVSHR